VNSTRLGDSIDPLFDIPLVIVPHISKVPFRIVDVPGRWRGVVATHPITKGTIFFREPPLYVGAWADVDDGGPTARAGQCTARFGSAGGAARLS
jgi:hypothetical protein